MSSKDRETTHMTTPPKSASVAKMQQTSLLDSPSRVTRSQVRRMSAVDASSGYSVAPASPAGRRTLRSRHSVAGSAGEDSDAASVQSEPGGGVVTRRSTRASSQQPRSPPKVEVKRTRRNSLSSGAPTVSLRSTRARPRLSPVPAEETSPAKSPPKGLLGVSPPKSPVSPREGGFSVSPRRLTFSDEKKESPTKDNQSSPKLVLDDMYLSEFKRLSLRTAKSPRLAMKTLESKLDEVAAKTRENQSESVNSDKAATPKSSKTELATGKVNSPRTPGSVEETSPKTPESGTLKSTCSRSQSPTAISESKMDDSPRGSTLGRSEKGVTPQTPLSDKPGTLHSRSQTPQGQATTPQTRSQTPPSESGKKTGTPQTRSPLIEKTGTPQTRSPLIEKTGTPQTRSPLIEKTGTPQTRSPLIEKTGTPQIRSPLIEKTGTPQIRSPLMEKTGTPQTRSQTPDEDCPSQASGSESDKKSAPRKEVPTPSSRSQTPLSESGKRASTPETRSQTPQTPQSGLEGKMATPQSRSQTALGGAGRREQTPAENRRTRFSTSESENLNKSGVDSPRSPAQSRTQGESDVASSACKSDGVFKTPVGTPLSRYATTEQGDRGSPRVTGSPARSPRVLTRTSDSMTETNMEEETDEGVPLAEEDAEVSASKNVEESSVGGEDDSGERVGKRQEDGGSLDSSHKSPEDEKLLAEGTNEKKATDRASDNVQSEISDEVNTKKDDSREDLPEKSKIAKGKEEESEDDYEEEDGREGSSETVQESDEERAREECIDITSEEDSEEEIVVVTPKKIAVLEDTDEDSDGEANIAEVQEIEEDDEDEDGVGLETEDEDEEEKKSPAVVLEIDGSDTERDKAKEVTVENVREFFDFEAEEDNHLSLDEEEDVEEDEGEEDDGKEAVADDEKGLIYLEAEEDDCLSDDDDDDEEEDDDEYEDDGFIVNEEEEEEEDDDVDSTGIPELEVSKSTGAPAYRRILQVSEGSDVSQRKTDTSLQTDVKRPEIHGLLTPKLFKPFNVNTLSKSAEKRQRTTEPGRRKSDDGRFKVFPFPSTDSKDDSLASQKNAKELSRTSFSFSFRELPSSDSSPESIDVSNREDGQDSRDKNVEGITEIQVISASPVVREREVSSANLAQSKSPAQQQQDSRPSTVADSKTTAGNKKGKKKYPPKRRRFPEEPHESDYDFDLMDDIPVTKVSSSRRNFFEVRDLACAPEKSLQKPPKCRLSFVVRESSGSRSTVKISKAAAWTGAWNVKPIKETVESRNLEKTEDATVAKDDKMKKRKKKKRHVDEVQFEEVSQKKSKKNKRGESIPLPLDVDDLRHKLTSSRKTSSLDKQRKKTEEVVINVASGSKHLTEKKKHKKSKGDVMLAGNSDVAGERKSIISKVPLGSNFPIEPVLEKSEGKAKKKKKEHVVAESSTSGQVEEGKKKKKHVENDVAESSTSDKAEKRKKKKKHVEHDVAESSTSDRAEKSKKKKHIENDVAESSTSDKAEKRKKKKKHVEHDVAESSTSDRAEKSKKKKHIENDVAESSTSDKAEKRKKKKKRIENAVAESLTTDKAEKPKKKKYVENDVAESSTSHKTERKRKALFEAFELINVETKKKKARTEEKLEKKAEENCFKSDDAGLDRKEKKKRALQERLEKELSRYKKVSGPLWGSPQADDDDEAPTAVSFSESRQSVLEEESKKKAFLEEKKRLQREKKNLELHQIMEQKAEKAKRKLDHGQDDYNLEDYFKPSKVLVPKGKKTYFSETRDEPSSSKLYEQAGPSKKKRRTEETSSKEERREKKLAEREQKRKEKGLAELLKRRKMAGSSFIPLEAPTGATRFGVVPLKNLNNDGNRLAEGPSDFRSQMLYGNRVNRVSNNVYQSQNEKKKVANAFSAQHTRWD